MNIAVSLQQFLQDQGPQFDLVPHKRTLHSSESARACSIPEGNLAKAILVKRGNGYFLAILPASCHLRLDELRSRLDPSIDLATEAEVARLFMDCELGSVPAIPAAYELEAVIDESLDGLNDIYFEGRDHCTLVHMTGREFQRLTAGYPHGRFGRRNHCSGADRANTKPSDENWRSNCEDVYFRCPASDRQGICAPEGLIQGRIEWL